MKKLYILMATIMAVAVMACKGAKSGTMVKSKKAQENTMAKNNESTGGRVEQNSGSTGGNTNMDSVVPENGQSPVQGTNAGAVAQSSGSTGAANNLEMSTSPNGTGSARDFEKLYSYLQMSDDQVNKFKKGMENFQHTKVNKPNGEMMGSIENEQERQFKTILSEDQFQKYEQWKDNNGQNR